jgi:hypothetical protein
MVFFFFFFYKLDNNFNNFTLKNIKKNIHDIGKYLTSSYITDIF